MAFKGWPRVDIMTAEGVKSGIAPLIISASRATDVPSFYGEWFMRRLQAGYLCWKNPFNAGCYQYVSLKAVRAIVFWTKNSEPFERELDVLEASGYCYYFLFTLNDYGLEGLEPGIPALAKRIDSFRRLSRRIGRSRVIWRYDPLVLGGGLDVEEHLLRIGRIGEQLEGYTEKLVFSLADIDTYGSVPRKLQKHGFNWRNFTMPDRERLALGLKKLCAERGLQVASCAEKPDFRQWGIPANSCIDGGLMLRIKPEDTVLRQFLNGNAEKTASLFGPYAVQRLKDRGQRNPCGCIAGKDIGQYNTCPHGCVYCYANNRPNLVERNWQRHDKEGGTIC